MQLPGLEKRPDLLAVVGVEQRRLEAPEPVAHLVDVTHQQHRRAVIARRIDCLGQVDDHRALAVDQHVEFGKIAMHQPGAQHAHHVGDDTVVIIARLLRAQRHLAQARGDTALAVADQVHQQHAVDEAMRPRHAYPRRVQPVQGIHLGAEPGRFLLLLTVAGLLGHRPGTPAVTLLATLLILNGLLEAALTGFLEHLGATPLCATAHHIDLGFLAAHQLADDLVDQSIFEQRLESFGDFHITFS